MVRCQAEKVVNELKAPPRPIEKSCAAIAVRRRRKLDPNGTHEGAFCWALMAGKCEGAHDWRPRCSVAALTAPCNNRRIHAVRVRVSSAATRMQASADSR